MSDDDQPEPKSERFNMFMSPSEMKAIDDWAWENRIRSKSEAVRRLCQIGLRANREIPALLRNVNSVTDQIAAGIIKAQEIARRFEGSIESAPEMAQVLFRNTEAAADLQMTAMSHVFDMVSEISALGTAPDMASAIVEADRRRAAFGETLAKVKGTVAEQAKASKGAKK